MLDLESMIKASRIKLLTKYFDDNDSFWKTTFETFCEKYGGVNSLLRANYDMKFIDIKFNFYKEVYYGLYYVKKQLEKTIYGTINVSK